MVVDFDVGVDVGVGEGEDSRLVGRAARRSGLGAGWLWWGRGGVLLPFFFREGMMVARW